jgi:hypothetical protein
MVTIVDLSKLAVLEAAVEGKAVMFAMSPLLPITTVEKSGDKVCIKY